MNNWYLKTSKGFVKDFEIDHTSKYEFVPTMFSKSVDLSKRFNSKEDCAAYQLKTVSDCEKLLHKKVKLIERINHVLNNWYSFKSLEDRKKYCNIGTYVYNREFEDMHELRSRSLKSTIKDQISLAKAVNVIRKGAPELTESTIRFFPKQVRNVQWIEQDGLICNCCGAKLSGMKFLRTPGGYKGSPCDLCVCCITRFAHECKQIVASIPPGGI